MLGLLRLDAVQLFRERLAIIVLAIGSAACLLAVVAGHAWVKHLAEEAASFAQSAKVEKGATRERWAKASGMPAEEAVLLPTRVTVAVALGMPLLPDFTIGRSAIEPTSATVRMATRPDAVFARYQVENPERLSRGAFDLGFVVVVLAPLLLIGLSYGVFVGDRDTGIARTWLAQAGSPIRLLLVRSLNRLALVCVPVVAAAVTLLILGPNVDGRATAGLVWLGVALLGILFWWTVILIVNSFRITAESAALVLVACWALLVFVIPVATTSLSTLLNPPPSRFEQITAARAAEVRAGREFDDDHPDLSATTLAGRRASVDKGIRVRSAVATAVAPLRQRYESRNEAQQKVTRSLEILSPPLLTANALAAISGTDAAAYARQRSAAVEYLPALERALIDTAQGRRSIDAATYDALPSFMSPRRSRPALSGTALLFLITVALAIVATSRLRRVQPL